MDITIPTEVTRYELELPDYPSDYPRTLAIEDETRKTLYDLECFTDFKTAYDLMTVLRTTIELLKGHPFVPVTRTEGREATALAVRNHLLTDSDLVRKALNSSFTFAEAQSLLQWVKGLGPQRLGFVQTMQTVCQHGLEGGFVDASAIGVVCAIPKAHEREKNPAPSGSQKEYVGIIGQNLTTECTITHIRNGVSPQGHAWTMTKALDAKNCILTWFYPVKSEYAVGDTLTVRGRIVSHKEFGGQYQTTLNVADFTKNGKIMGLDYLD